MCVCGCTGELGPSGGKGNIEAVREEFLAGRWGPRVLREVFGWEMLKDFPL